MSKPLLGARFAATFVDERTEGDLASKVRGLGGEFHHKMDASVRFLVVGKRYTRKYDFALAHGITLLSADAFFDVYVRWRGGEELDFAAELAARRLRPFEGELVCLSNMDARQKEGFHELVLAGGGEYSIAFARVNTVLVTPERTGRKMDGALKWGTPAVHPKWISDSLKFGAALNPERYSVTDADAPMAPPPLAAGTTAEGCHGSAASLAVGGDASDATAATAATAATVVRPLLPVSGEQPPQPPQPPHAPHAPHAPMLKRRRGADLLFSAPLAKRDRGASSSGGSAAALTSSFSEPPHRESAADAAGRAAAAGRACAGVAFELEGFDARQLGILQRAVRSLGGHAAQRSAHDPERTQNYAAARYVVVPSARAPALRCTAVSDVAGAAAANKKATVTEWAIERSLYLKRNALDDIWGRPVYTQPVPGLRGLAVCVSGFVGIEQRHATLLLQLVGATFCETLTAERDVLVAAHAQAHKVPYAVAWGVPVVRVDWLWECALAGRALGLRDEHVLDNRGAREAPRPRAYSAAGGGGHDTSERSRDAEHTSKRNAERNAGPTPDHTVEHSAENTADHTAEHSAEHSAENTAEHTAEHTADSLVEPCSPGSASTSVSAAYDGGTVGYLDDDAEARAQVLISLGEKPVSQPEFEPAATPVSVMLSSRYHSSSATVRGAARGGAAQR